MGCACDRGWCFCHYLILLECCLPNYVLEPASSAENGHGVQGVVESRTLEDNRGIKYTMVLFSRRSRLHPGMRYIARGLNSLASPGNEIECEQVHFVSPLFPAVSTVPSHGEHGQRNVQQHCETAVEPEADWSQAQGHVLRALWCCSFCMCPSHQA